MRLDKILCAALLFGLLSVGSAACSDQPTLGEMQSAEACTSRSTAWIRQALRGEGDTEEEQLVTELLILGHAVSPDEQTASDCLYRAQFDYEGSVTLDQGYFVLDEATLQNDDESYRGTWTTEFRYELLREPELELLARRGAIRQELYPASQREIAFRRAGERLILTVDGVTKEFHELPPLVASLDVDDSRDRSYLLRLLNLGLLTSQARIIGFGSAGMTGYRSPKDFSGLIGGELNVGIHFALGDVDTTLSYGAFSDIPGVILEGPQRVEVTWGGDGIMGGVQRVDLSMDADDTPFTSVEVDYSNVVVKHGFGHSGTLELSTDRQAYEVDVRDAFVVDFRGLIPLADAAE